MNIIKPTQLQKSYRNGRTPPRRLIRQVVFLPVSIMGSEVIVNRDQPIEDYAGNEGQTIVARSVWIESGCVWTSPVIPFESVWITTLQG